jgi:ABC-type glycerol-3-phosphate transport system substrate-binding protein
MRKNAFQLLLVGVIVTVFTLPSFAAGPGDIKWNSPAMVERITGQGSVEAIPEEYNDYGVELAGKKGMLTGYQLPEGWKEAIGDVKSLVLTNSGGLKHDPATVLNAKIFEKMTGIHLDLIEMKDPLLWPKTLAVSMAKSTDVDIFYATRSMLEIPHLSAAGWVHPVDELWPPEVRKLYPEKLLNTIMGVDGKYYGSPFCLWAMHLFYRPSWLEKAGVEVPKTWQELVPATKKVDEWAEANMGPGNDGMVYPAGDPDTIHQIWSMLTFSQDKRIMQDRKVVIDPEAWKILTGLWTEGGMSKESIEYVWSAAPEVFAKGKAGFIVTGGVYMNNFANPEFGTGVQNDWAVTLLPSWEGVGKPATAVAGNDSWMMNPNIGPEKIAAAMLWFDYQRSYQAQFNELYLEGNESVMMSVYDHPAIKTEVTYPDLRSATVAAQIGEAYPPGMMDVLSILMEYLHKVALGEMDADEALKTAQDEIDMIM